MHPTSGLITKTPFPLFLLASIGVYGLLFPLLSWTTFSGDDAHILRVAAEYNWLPPFYSHEVYTQLSASNFTPFVLTIYRVLLQLFGLSSAAFLAFMLLSIAAFTALAGQLAWQLTNSRSLPWLLMLLLYSIFTLPSLLTRFYTSHYILGGCFALFSLILAFRHDNRALQHWLCGFFLLLAMLCKEVYVVLPAILILPNLINRSYKNILPTLTAVAAYLFLRITVIGETGNEGRSAAGIISALLAIGSANWLHFLLWYGKTRAVILLATVVAILVSPKRVLKLLPLALVFVLPTLAAPHGFLMPELHGDRIFFALDGALAMAAVVAMHGSILESSFDRRMALPALLALVLIVALSIHYTNNAALKNELQQTPDYKITEYMLREIDSLESKTLFVPLAFTQGDIANVQTWLGHPAYEITHNCLLALASPADQLIAFNNAGDLIDRQQLEDSCQAAAPDVEVLVAPRVDKGYIQWELRFADGFSGGVLFVDRGYAAPTASFSLLMGNPKPGERYQLFANRGNQWWFSPVMPIEVRD